MRHSHQVQGTVRCTCPIDGVNARPCLRFARSARLVWSAARGACYNSTGDHTPVLPVPESSLMRRLIFKALGVLELLSALVLFGFVWTLPHPADVHQSVDRVSKVTRQTSTQVDKLRQQIGQIREKQPEARRLAEDMRVQLRALSGSLERQQVEPNTLRTMHDALG